MLTLPIFDAVLFAPQGVWAQERPFALELTYLRNLKGKHIAERSVSEMRHQGEPKGARLERWSNHMRGLFPDVARDTRLTGVRDADGFMRLYRGSQSIGEVREPEFTMAFFNIWLGPKTSQPKLREQLLGLSA